MINKLPVELTLLIISDISLDDHEQLALVNKRMMQIFRKFLPIALLPRIGNRIEKVVIRPKYNGVEVALGVF